MSLFEDLVKEFVGKGGEVIDSRGLRIEVNQLRESTGRLVGLT